MGQWVIRGKKKCEESDILFRTHPPSALSAAQAREAMWARMLAQKKCVYMQSILNMQFVVQIPGVSSGGLALQFWCNSQTSHGEIDRAGGGAGERKRSRFESN